ncbi:helix-turn-helix domain-containing protein [Dyadobacter pollutisoli]|jgi:polyhydroxyalkanoate synthesis regulator phasin|uniref:Helix-turn-helix transcriptional regulator n=1 Tax=Dyadobacter pollutisoli TaxID=2910158 RepID=A0A9E8SK98_9BACT|nr:helix-turn-helix transcriptional regulator [Dyadobacter pollutisoli]WAC12240.1 helix-turn-helix transcriptional regulator [Dyadobacter pollutisoli]
MFSERLKHLIEYLGISITSFEASIGVSKGAIAKPIKNQKTVGVEVLGKILIKYSNVNLEWLVCGVDSMLKDNRDNRQGNIEDHPSENLITITKDEFIELQRKALRQEDRIRELERQVQELGKTN